MRLSQRVPDCLEPNALSRALDARRRSGLPLHDLTLSNPTGCGLGLPEAWLPQVLSQASLTRYRPDAQGDRAVREAIAAHHGHGVHPDQVLLTTSTSESYAWLFKLLGDPGDGVVVPTPSYPLFPWLARLEGLEVHEVPCFWHERWHLDEDALEATITPRTAAMIVVHPNNPTGQFLTRGEWESLTHLCARHRMALLVDEVFVEVPLEPAPEALGTVLAQPDPPCPVFVLSGLSKLALLPQVKLGWIMAHGAWAQEALPALAFLADQYLSVSAMAQALAPAALARCAGIRAQLRERLLQNLQLLDAALGFYPPLSRFPVEGGWSAILRMPALEPAETCALRLVEEQGVLVHPGPFFDLPEGHLVVSLLPEPDRFAAGLELLTQGLAASFGVPSRSPSEVGRPLGHA